MDFRNTTDENSPPITCSKPGCKRLVTSSQFKRCDPCRICQRGLVKVGRQQQKAADTANVLKGKKRAREENSSSEERPTQQVRPNSPGLVAENPHIISNDDDDDGLPFWDLDNKVSY